MHNQGLIIKLSRPEWDADLSSYILSFTHILIRFEKICREDRF